MKIYVYAICKNEEKFVDKWVESMSEADGIYVLDTGSTDSTVELLKNKKVNVDILEIKPWRFDLARNEALKRVPEDADICVSTDLDEVFHPGWRKKLENAWTPGTTNARYRYTWNFNPDGSEGVVFWMSKIHTRHGVVWKHPVHEVLEYDKPCKSVEVAGLQLDHHADDSKPRSQYLPLLELSVKESPEDDRNMHYLGREYMYYGKWAECELTLKKHLSLKTALWKDERAASMRFIAKAVEAQGRDNEAYGWLMKAIAEAPHLREPWIDAASFEARHQNYLGSLYFAEKALDITNRSKTYINEAENWGAKPYDIAAVAAYYLKFYELALSLGSLALAYDPNNKRLQTNMVFYKKALQPS